MLNERAGVGTGQIKTKFLAPRRIICPVGQRPRNKRQGRGEKRGKGSGRRAVCPRGQRTFSGYREGRCGP